MLIGCKCYNFALGCLDKGKDLHKQHLYIKSVTIWNVAVYNKCVN